MTSYVKRNGRYVKRCAPASIISKTASCKRFSGKKQPFARQQSAASGITPFIVLGALLVLALWAWQDHVMETAKRHAADDQVAEEILSAMEVPVSTGGQHKAPIERWLAAMRTVESHGDCSAVSPKGARGCWQIMPATAKQPGLGVKPLRNHSEGEEKRFARDYFSALLVYFHDDVKRATAAYNAGLATIASGEEWPDETKSYVKKVSREYAANN